MASHWRRFRGLPSTVHSSPFFPICSVFCPPFSRRIKIPLLRDKGGDKERKGNIETVEVERRHAMEACIVRIMKARKKYSHADLVDEAVAQMSRLFKPSGAMLKRRIEDLISRDYLERDPRDRNLYNYLA